MEKEFWYVTDDFEAQIAAKPVMIISKAGTGIGWAIVRSITFLASVCLTD